MLNDYIIAQAPITPPNTQQYDYQLTDTYHQDSILNALTNTYGPKAITDQAILTLDHHTYYIIATKTPHRLALELSPITTWKQWAVLQGTVPNDPQHRHIDYPVSPTNLIPIIRNTTTQQGRLNPQDYTITSISSRLTLTLHTPPQRRVNKQTMIP
jgi:hypothetical protein